MKTIKENKGAIHCEPGKAGIVKCSSICKPWLYSSTGIDNTSETQNLRRNICSCPV